LWLVAKFLSMMTDSCHIWADSKGNLIVHILSFMIGFLLLAFRFLSSLVDLLDSCQWGLDMIFGDNLLVIGGWILVIGGWAPRFLPFITNTCNWRLILVTGGWILSFQARLSSLEPRFSSQGFSLLLGEGSHRCWDLGHLWLFFFYFNGQTLSC
jgi:hypothetical protein